MFVYILYWAINEPYTDRIARPWYRKAPMFPKIQISMMRRRKILKLFIEANLVEVLMCTKLRVKIRKYDFAEKSESCRNISVKLLYLS
jgi:hypothetical protein